MKTLILFIIGSLFFVSCSATKESQRSEILSAIDFSKYTSQGFLITPLEYNKDYESIGLLNLTIYPSVTTLPQTYSSIDGYVLLDENAHKWFIEKIKTQEAIDNLYNACIQMEADALMQFRMDVVYKMNGTLQVPGLEISGFAIKRK